MVSSGRIEFFGTAPGARPAAVASCCSLLLEELEVALVADARSPEDVNDEDRKRIVAGHNDRTLFMVLNVKLHS